MKGAKLEVETLLVTCLSQHLSDLIKRLSLPACPLTTSSPPAGHQLRRPDQTAKETGCVMANIGASTVSVVVFEDGLPISLEVFPIGSSHITNDIALGL